MVRRGLPTEQILACRAFPLGDEFVGVSLSDVTTATLASQALRRQALHDGLTGLPNRTLLQDRLGQSLRESARSGEPVALLVMDLDQFKEINDALGHHVGDQVLIELANRLQQVVRGADVIARLGGDEFALLMTTDVSLEAAVQMAERVKAALVEPFVIGELRLQTNASIGIAVHPEHGTDAESLTQRADVAMYQAKRSGSGHAVYKAELDRSSVRRLTLLERAAPGPRPQRVRPPLPADHPGGHRRGRAGRGARALGAPAAGHARPRPVHRPRRGVRLHPAAHPLGRSARRRPPPCRGGRPGTASAWP